MKNKVILISIDGMRPDGVKSCGNPFVDELMKKGSYTFNAKTVFPSVTLPCHMSMFHSVTPERHGITTNDFVPQVRPINGIFEQVKLAKGISSFYYGWEPLRNIATPAAFRISRYLWAYLVEDSDSRLTDQMIADTTEFEPDFVFLYMVETDEKGGHDNGWMTDAYLARISNALDNVKRVIDKFGDRYTVIVTADHGGHDRCHGSDRDEDMTIPMFFVGKEFEAGRELCDVSILDIAPTVAAVMGIYPADEWEGRTLVNTDE